VIPVPEEEVGGGALAPGGVEFASGRGIEGSSQTFSSRSFFSDGNWAVPVNEPAMAFAERSEGSASSKLEEDTGAFLISMAT
jgi:hypothetical protein